MIDLFPFRKSKYWEYAFCIFFIFLFAVSKTSAYNSYYVEAKQITYNNEKYYVVVLKSIGVRIKAKYFACGDNAGNSVAYRYNSWKYGKDVILFSSGTYMSNWSQKIPQGLTIENGIVVNRNLINDKMDALVVVRHSGDIVVVNLKKSITLSGGNIEENRRFDLRGNPMDRYDFINWAQKMEVTAFQAHLLVFNDELQIAGNSSAVADTRRFLAMGTDNNGTSYHILIQCPEKCSLLNGAKGALAALKWYKEMNIKFMINLDTGGQDVFKVFSPDGGTYESIGGQNTLNDAANLLTYYFD